MALPDEVPLSSPKPFAREYVLTLHCAHTHLKSVGP